MLYYLFLRDYSATEYAESIGQSDWNIRGIRETALKKIRKLYGGISSTYRIVLEKDAPVIVWDFHSLLIMVQMCFSFMLTDKDSDMRMCKHCKKAFVASRKGNEFCSQKYKNQFNVYKSREKKRNKSDNR